MSIELGSGIANGRIGSDGATVLPHEIPDLESAASSAPFRRSGSGGGNKKGKAGGTTDPTPGVVAVVGKGNSGETFASTDVAVPAATPVERGLPVAPPGSGDLADDDSFDADAFFEEDLGDDHPPGEDRRIREEDLDRLLGPLPDDRERRRERRKGLGICPCCPQSVRNGPCSAAIGKSHDGEEIIARRVGNMIVLFPNLYSRMGVGIVGPHWFGPVCTFGLLTIATVYYAPSAYQWVGPVSSLVCVLFYVVATVSLAMVSCSDPGVVRPVADGGPGASEADGKNGYTGVRTKDEESTTGGTGAGGRDWTNWRYCDLCSVHQPPDAAHCPDCNVCVEGYDHHCPWMGTCIGKRNFKAFMIFNFSWLFYFLYAFTWVTFFGPAAYGSEVKNTGS